MRTAHRSVASAARAASFVAFVGLICAGAAQAAGGSTDMYAPNGIAASLGAPAAQATPVRLTASYGGSTDTWGLDGFRTSFGRGNPVPQSIHVCGSGSTDIYGADGFLASFGSPAFGSRIDLAQACQGAATVSR